MNNPHTSGPWKLNASGEPVIPLEFGEGPAYAVLSPDEDYSNWKADAQRIVLCVNACEGLSNEELCTIILRHQNASSTPLHRER